MLTQPAAREMMGSLQALWTACFGEGEGYADLVFGKLLRPERIFTIPNENGDPLAMLCYEPVPVRAGTGTFAGAYLYGVATHPAQQGRGLSTWLLEESHTLLRQRGADLSFLVPAAESLFGFYGKRGYRTAFAYRKVGVESWQLPAGEAGWVLSAAGLDSLDRLREERFGDCALFPAWGGDWLRYTDAECRWLGGEVVRWAHRGKKGYAVCYPVGDKLLVKELCVEPGELGGLLGALHARFGKNRYELRLPLDFPSPWPGLVLPFAMVKWYDKDIEHRADGSGGRSPWLAFVLD